jgi:hypothetical protein
LIGELLKVGARGGEQSTILDIPELGVSPSGEIRHELSEPPVWIPIAQRCDLLQEFLPIV